MSFPYSSKVDYRLVCISMNHASGQFQTRHEDTSLYIIICNEALQELVSFLPRSRHYDLVGTNDVSKKAILLPLTTNKLQ